MNPATGENERLLEIIRVQNEIAAADLDLDAAMALIAERACTLTDAEAATIAVVEGEELVARAASRTAVHRLGERGRLAGTLGGAALRERRVLVSEDCETDPRVDPVACRRFGARSLLVVPLVHGEEVQGVLTAYAAEPRRFGAGDVRALDLIAATLSAQIEHATRFAAEAHRSIHDALTGLMNRRAYEERLPVEVARAARSRRSLALVLLDLDGFKAINDHHGHPAGDQVLRNIAASIRRARLSDDLFRIGGDEFAILLPETTRAEAEQAMARLLAQLDVGPVADLEPDFGVSFGIGAGAGLDPATIHAAADHELMIAKRALYANRARRPAGIPEYVRAAA